MIRITSLVFLAAACAALASPAALQLLGTTDLPDTSGDGKAGAKVLMYAVN